MGNGLGLQHRLLGMDTRGPAPLRSRGCSTASGCHSLSKKKSPFSTRQYWCHPRKGQTGSVPPVLPGFCLNRDARLPGSPDLQPLPRHCGWVGRTGTRTWNNEKQRVRDSQRREGGVRKPCVKPAAANTQPGNGRDTPGIGTVLSGVPAEARSEPCAAACQGGGLILYIATLPCLWPLEEITALSGRKHCPSATPMGGRVSGTAVSKASGRNFVSSTAMHRPTLA